MIIQFNQREFVSYFEALLLATEICGTLPGKSTIEVLRYLPKDKIVHEQDEVYLDKTPPHEQLSDLIHKFKIPKVYFSRIPKHRIDVIQQCSYMNREMDSLNDFCDGVEVGLRMQVKDEK